MVFFIKETLTAEDKMAWRQMMVKREKAVRKERRAVARDWAERKIMGFSCIIFGVLIAFAVVRGGVGGLWIFFSLYCVFGGVCILAWKPPRIEQTVSLPASGLPPSRITDMPVRAVFFGDGCFSFWESSKKTRLGYHAVTAAWEDTGRFYLFFQDRPPLILPKRGLGRWMPEDFRDFLDQELEQPVRRTT